MSAQESVPDGGQGTRDGGSKRGSGQDGDDVNASEAIGRLGEQRVDPAPDKAVPAAEQRRPQGILQAGGGGGKSERSRSPVDRRPQERQSQFHPRSRHAGRSTRLIGSPSVSREGVSWATRTRPRGSPMTRVSGAAGRRREERRGEIASFSKSRVGGGSGSASVAVDVSALAGGRRRSATSSWGGSDVSTSSVELSEASLNSTRVASLTSMKAASVADSESGNAGMGGKGAWTPRDTVEQGSNPGFFELLTTTPKVSMKETYAEDVEGRGGWGG